MTDSSKPKASGTEFALIVVGAVVGAGIGFGLVGPMIGGIAGSAVAGAIAGLGAVLGGMSYFRRVQAWQDSQKG